MLLGNELRNGSQQIVPGTNKFVQRCFNKIDSLGVKRSEILLRADSGHDDKRFLKLLNESGSKYLPKYERESRYSLLDLGLMQNISKCLFTREVIVADYKQN